MSERIYRETLKKEAQHPDYAADLAVKRAEGLEYEAAIITLFNELSWRSRMVPRSGHTEVGADFFSSFDAHIEVDGEEVVPQVELKGRSQWKTERFPYPTIIVNANKVERAKPESLIVYCDHRAAKVLWLYDLTQLLSLPRRDFRINKRGDVQINEVIDIPVEMLTGGMHSLVKFMDTDGYRGKITKQ